MTQVASIPVKGGPFDGMSRLVPIDEVERRPGPVTLAGLVADQCPGDNDDPSHVPHIHKVERVMYMRSYVPTGNGLPYDREHVEEAWQYVIVGAG